MDWFSLQITFKIQIAKWWCCGMRFLAFQDVILFSPVAKYQEATCSTIKRSLCQHYISSTKPHWLIIPWD